MKTTQDILTGALRLCKVIEVGESPEADDIETAIDSLNDMVTGWQNDHTFTWQQREIHIPLDGSESYVLGPNGSVKYDGIKATATALAPIGQTFLELDSTSLMSDGDAYVIGANSGDIVQVYDATKIIIPALTEQVEIGDIITVDEKTIPKPLRLYDVNFWNGNTEIPINMISREEYRDFPNKNNPGQPNQIFYDRQLRDGIMYVWPVGSTGEIRVMADLSFTSIEMSEITEPMPFPENWFQALKYGLAVVLDGYFGLGLSEMTLAIAAGSYEDVKGEDTEGSDSIFIGGGEDYYNINAG